MLLRLHQCREPRRDTGSWVEHARANSNMRRTFAPPSPRVCRRLSNTCERAEIVLGKVVQRPRQISYAINSCDLQVIHVRPVSDSSAHITGSKSGRCGWVAFLRALDATKQPEAEGYVRQAPAQIDTPYRRLIERELGWLRRG